MQQATLGRFFSIPSSGKTSDAAKKSGGESGGLGQKKSSAASSTASTPKTSAGGGKQSTTPKTATNAAGSTKSKSSSSSPFGVLGKKSEQQEKKGDNNKATELIILNDEESREAQQKSVVVEAGKAGAAESEESNNSSEKRKRASSSSAGATCRKIIESDDESDYAPSENERPKTRQRKSETKSSSSQDNGDGEDGDGESKKKSTKSAKPAAQNKRKKIIDDEDEDGDYEMEDAEEEEDEDDKNNDDDYDAGKKPATKANTTKASAPVARPAPAKQQAATPAAKKPAAAAAAASTSTSSSTAAAKSSPAPATKFQSPMSASKAPAAAPSPHSTTTPSSSSAYSRRDANSAPIRLLVRPGMGVDKMTPLEQQVVAVKKQYPDTLLMVECGYKYRFFGEDADVASQVLNILAREDKHFLTASVPTQRRDVHLRRLVEAGYKVGIVSQRETANLKAASSSKGTVFKRDLTEMYTKATMSAFDLDENTGGFGAGGGQSFMMSVIEESGSGGEDDVEIGIVAVDVSSGDIVYDSFSDNAMRGGLETRIQTLSPKEYVRPLTLSKRSAFLISTQALPSNGGARIQEMNDRFFEEAEAVKKVEKLLKDDERKRHGSQAAEGGAAAAASSSTSSTGAATSGGGGGGAGLEEDGLVTNVTALPRLVIRALGALLQYLAEFKLESTLSLTPNFWRFSSREHMLLDATTLAALEILKNQEGSGEGSLAWLLNKTKTAFGARQLRNWIARPLLNARRIRDRSDAVEELRDDPPALENLLKLMTTLPDLEKSLTRVHLLKCSPLELYNVLSSFLTACKAIEMARNKVGQLSSSLLRNLVESVPHLVPILEEFLNELNPQAIREQQKENILVDNGEKYPRVVQCKIKIREIEKKLDAHMVDLRRDLGAPELSFVHMTAGRYLIEIQNKSRLASRIPKDWHTVNSTKEKTRYQSPETLDLFKLLRQMEEQLQIDCSDAWAGFQSRVSNSYPQLRSVAQRLGVLDALFSLSVVAKNAGWVKPEIVDSNVKNSGSGSGGSSSSGASGSGNRSGEGRRGSLSGLSAIGENSNSSTLSANNDDGSSGHLLMIENGRHPMVEATSAVPFVPNDCNLTGDMRTMLITGPNMGGKSSYIRQVALIVVLAQIGSFVPADRAKLKVFDGVFTRMGASDSIQTGRSTFLVELEETAHILKHASDRSLVILDELGRGTSTHDGVAIAEATLSYLISKTKCLTLFVTHYQLLSRLQSDLPGLVTNYHMSFIEEEDHSDGGDAAAAHSSITFLYKLVKGSASRSYGLNVARLAHVPPSVLSRAAEKSAALENVTDFMLGKVQKMGGGEAEIEKVLRQLLQMSDSDQVEGIQEELNSIWEKVGRLIV